MSDYRCTAIGFDGCCKHHCWMKVVEGTSLCLKHKDFNEDTVINFHGQMGPVSCTAKDLGFRNNEKPEPIIQNEELMSQNESEKVLERVKKYFNPE